MWIVSTFRKLIKRLRMRQYKNVSSTSVIQRNVKVYNKDNLVMGEDTNINAGAIIMNTRARFVMGNHSGAAFGLRVITGNHMSVVGKNHHQISDSDKDLISNSIEFDKDIIVEEDVWLGADVTLLFGTYIKRGAIIGAGSVVRSVIPPYAIATGNPAKVIGFRFSPQEILEHEAIIYRESERIPASTLEKNYKKYFLNRIKEISTYIKP